MRYSSLPIETLQSWAFLNQVAFHGSKVEPHIRDADGTDKGGGLVATETQDAQNVLLTIPRGLILNKSTVDDAIRSDTYLREVLSAVGPTLSQTPRTVIMIFLLLQLTYTSPDLETHNIGVKSPLTDYVKFLPKHIPLPTVYSSSQRELLAGTSLETALKQKLKRLDQEFEHLKASTQNVSWCQKFWWDEETGVLTVDDWVAVDAMYRSRALELPFGVGDSMVPVLDMANHASDDNYNARFQMDSEGNAQLVVRDRVSIATGNEITIMYGCGGACEMIFSYGFLERDAQSAREMFLDLEIPEDDPLRRAKVGFAREAPGVRLYTNSRGQIEWDSSFVWWACVNQEDGLDFGVLQQIDGETELKATWKGSDLQARNLKQVLIEDANWDIFLLRAIVLLQGRVEEQGINLSLSQELFDAVMEAGNGGPIVNTVNRLRDLEMELLSASFHALEQEKQRSLATESVRTYLNNQGPDRTDGAEDDFS